MKKLFARVLSDYLALGCVSHGAALAFYALFALLPVPIFAVSAAATLVGDELARAEVVRILRALAGAPTAATLAQALDAAGAVTSWRGAQVFGLASLVFGATAFFGELQDTLNKIWRAGADRSGWRAILRSRLVSFAMVAASGTALLALTLVSALARGFGERLNAVLPLPAFMSRLEGLVMALVVVGLLFALVFRYVPETDVSFRRVWLGSLITAGLFLGGNELLGLYLRHTPLATAYGAAGSLVLTLTWIYYSALAFLLGAVLTHRLGEGAEGAAAG